MPLTMLPIELRRSGDEYPALTPMNAATLKSSSFALRWNRIASFGNEIAIRMSGLTSLSFCTIGVMSVANWS